mmetsp:Transcript_3766/g.5743  ORF Transcript_3766/g.5743 Transcript_3766/m.5743 type:complete len:899 (+) Transcript_3766:182-2878(+)
MIATARIAYVVIILLALDTANAFLSPTPHGSIRQRYKHSARTVLSRTTPDSYSRISMENSNSSNRSSPEWLKSGVMKYRKVMSKTKLAIQKILAWQKKRGISMITAAALSLSLLFSSTQGYDTFSQVNHPEICRVQKSSSSSSSSSPEFSPSVSLLRRGGEASSSSQRYTFWAKPQTVLDTTIVEGAVESTTKTIQEAFQDLNKFMQGAKSDTLLLLLATSLITPICKRFGTSPILGFLAAGMLLGPNGCGLISGIHTTETLAELGIVFFLFEMGIELSIERLMSMRKDVFGLGLSQFLLTAVAIAAAGSAFGLPANALVVLGGGLALSSSAFVLQLLKDKDQLATRFGKASFGVLLFQDLAVVPLLVVTPILAGSGTGLAAALGSAVLKANIALGVIALAGRFLLNPLFKTVAEAQSQEAFLGVILLTVLSMSFMTEGLGLSNTLGAFLAGVLLSETKYRYQVEADIAPFRGVLLGLFFVTVGFEIDVHLIASKFPQVLSLVVGIMGIKAAVCTLLSLVFGLSLSTSQQTGLILSQGGEFAFVAFGLARSLGILDGPTTKLLLTSVSLTMALTPGVASLGGKIAKKLEEESDFTHYLGQDSDAVEIKESEDFAVVVGYGAVGKIVCDLLDRKFYRYVGLETNPNKAIEARNKGLPVFYGDIGRPEVLEAFNVGSAKCVIVCISDKQQANRVVIAIRRLYPEIKIFCRAKDADHAERLQRTLDVAAMMPILPEDNILMTLPFGGAVLKSLGAAEEEVNAILEAKRKEVLSGRGLRDSEEEASLLQLGIKVDNSEETEGPVIDIVPDTDDTSISESGKGTKQQQAAAAVVEEIEAKSPILASVIEANCPGAVLDEKVDNDVLSILSIENEDESDLDKDPVLESESIKNVTVADQTAPKV